VHHGDPFFVLADYDAYIQAQDLAARCFLDSDRWTRLSILNAARMGHFSSDRTVAEYASLVWRVAPLERAAPAPVARPARGHDAERSVDSRSSIG
jgi:starch phosphorylase